MSNHTQQEFHQLSLSAHFVSAALQRNFPTKLPKIENQQVAEHNASYTTCATESSQHSSKRFNNELLQHYATYLLVIIKINHHPHVAENNLEQGEAAAIFAAWSRSSEKGGEGRHRGKYLDQLLRFERVFR